MRENPLQKDLHKPAKKMRYDSADLLPLAEGIRQIEDGPSEAAEKNRKGKRQAENDWRRSLPLDKQILKDIPSAESKHHRGLLRRSDMTSLVDFVFILKYTGNSAIDCSCAMCDTYCQDYLPDFLIYKLSGKGERP
jgi:hypothetical protein